jgi:hypothetical protein
MKRFFWLLIALLFANISFAQTPVKKASAGIAVDGHLEEEVWNVNNAVAINSGNSNNTAHFGLLWDDYYLYVGVEVNDNLLCNGRRQAFYDDGIEICLDGNHDQSSGFDNNDLQLIKPVKSYWLQEMNMNFGGIIHKYKETTTGYTMEFAIPWSVLNVTPSAGKQVGFNLIVNDDDNPGNLYNLPSQLIWAGNSSYHQSPQNWGSIQLSAQTAGFSGSYVALLSQNEGEFLINGKSAEIKWFSQGIDSVKIEYSSTNGSQWTVITEGTDAAAGMYPWQVSAPASEQFLIRISDAANQTLFDESDEVNILSATLVSSEPLIPSDWQNYTWPFNAFYPDDGNGGHIGNGCGPSSLARIIHSWKFPRQGSGALSFTDVMGNYWSADFGNTLYNYDNMPNHLSPGASQPEYTDVATLFLHAQVAMDDYYGTGTDLPNMGHAMHTYFNYKQSNVAYMHDYTPAEWTKLLKAEIDSGRSLLVQGMNLEYFGTWHTRNSIGGHWYHCDGYNEEGEFHIVVGFGNYQYDGYYSIEEFPIYSYNIGVLTGLEPDLDGKTLSLSQPVGGEQVTGGEPIEITWQSAGIQNLQIEYTLDNGQNWIEIEAATNASSGSYMWTTPSTQSNQCKIRLTDITNINVYDQSEAVFNLLDPQLALSYPQGGENFVFDNVALITWELTPVQEVTLEYTTDNGTSWHPIVSNFDASQSTYEWSVPQTATSQALIRISDSKDASNHDTSDPFEIVPENATGGPYILDGNTLLLWHAEGNLYNQSSQSGNLSQASGSLSYADNPVAQLGKAAYLNNGSDRSHLEVPHTSGLDLTGDWTIELWIKPMSYPQGLQYFVWKPGDNDAYFSNYSLQLNGYWDNKLFGFYFSGDDRIGVNTDFKPAIGQWYHLAFIRNTQNASLKLLVRNAQRELIKTYTISTNRVPSSSSQNLRIGFNFDGYVDEIRISDVVRSFESSLSIAPDLTDHYLISPNPASHSIRLNNQDRIDVKIFSLSGSCVASFEKVSPNALINLPALSNGLYILRLENGNHSISKKLIIRK